MALPLGGKRRERKKLKRCDHAGAFFFDDALTASIRVVCPRCDGRAIVSRVSMLHEPYSEQEFRAFALAALSREQRIPTPASTLGPLGAIV